MLDGLSKTFKKNGVLLVINNSWFSEKWKNSHFGKVISEFLTCRLETKIKMFATKKGPSFEEPFLFET